jgi:hypothetical protein
MACDRHFIRKVHYKGFAARYCFTMTHVTNNIRFFSIFQTIYGADEYGI